jgi:cellulose 1,4-beta-cellobiosidase
MYKLVYLSLLYIVGSINLGEKDEYIKFDDYDVVLDANWRWIHFNNKYDNCYDGSWKCDNCDDCILEGISKEKYDSVYGIRKKDDKLELQFITGSNIGSRVYLLKNNKYWFPDLLNKQLSIDIDVSELPCSLNSAVYLVQMNSTKYDVMGVGYGDAQCPTDIKYFYTGKVNKDKQQICSNEIDLIEANSEALAWTLHPCNYDNCDKSGADANSYRQGYKDFYGPGKTIDTKKPFTVITQFIGDPLIEVKRFYKQDDKLIEHIGGSLNSKTIEKWKQLQNEPNTFEENGGFASLTKAIKDGMVLVLSIWDDPATNMAWLDSNDRGPCQPNTNIRQKSPNVKVRFSNIKLESILYLSDSSKPYVPSEPSVASEPSIPSEPSKPSEPLNNNCKFKIDDKCNLNYDELTVLNINKYNSNKELLYSYNINLQ